MGMTRAQPTRTMGRSERQERQQPGWRRSGKGEGVGVMNLVTLLVHSRLTEVSRFSEVMLAAVE